MLKKMPRCSRTKPFPHFFSSSDQSFPYRFIFFRRRPCLLCFFLWRPHEFFFVNSFYYSLQQNNFYLSQWIFFCHGSISFKNSWISFSEKTERKDFRKEYFVKALRQPPGPNQSSTLLFSGSSYLKKGRLFFFTPRLRPRHRWRWTPLSQSEPRHRPPESSCTPTSPCTTPRCPRVSHRTSTGFHRCM